MSNFTFLTPNWPDLYATAREAEQNVASTPLSHRASTVSASLSISPLSQRTYLQSYQKVILKSHDQ